MEGRELWTGRLSTRPKDADINGDFSEYEDVVELIESLEVAPNPAVRMEHIRSAAEASGLFLLQRLGVAGVPLTQLLGRAAAVLLVLAVGLSALGAAAALPEPVQNAVATVAGYFGIDMPPGEGDSKSGLLPLLDKDSTPNDQPRTTPAVEDDAGETDGASAICRDEDDPRHESDEDEAADHECVDVDDKADDDVDDKADDDHADDEHAGDDHRDEDDDGEDDDDEDHDDKDEADDEDDD